jgi:hypothetical protein
MGGFIMCCLALVKSFLHLFLAPVPVPTIAQDPPKSDVWSGFDEANGMVHKIASAKQPK